MRPQDFEFIRDFVLEKSGISLSEDKIYLIKARLDSVLKREEIDSIGELVTRLRWKQNEELTNAIIDVMTTNETFFFRDKAPFEALKSRVIPALIKERSASKSISIWSAACSSGQEPYSIAMLLKEHFPELDDWNISILATDISPEILEKASKGYYTQFEIDRGLPPYLLKYFEKDGMGWRIKDVIRKKIKFERGNLMQINSALFPPMDIVFLRNVLIYFELDLKRKILNNVHRVLKNDGYLFLGQSETVSQLEVPFQACHMGSASCFRQKSYVQSASYS